MKYFARKTAALEWGSDMKNTFIVAISLFSLTQHGLAQTTVNAPTTSSIEAEKQRIEVQRKALFDPENAATKAQPTPLPSGSAVQKEMKRIEIERKELFDPKNPATSNAKNNFPNIPTPEVSNIDVEALAKRYEQRADARKMDDLMIFVSFTMPKASLKRIVAQANKVGASVILNGFKDKSLKATALAIKELGETSGNVLINPNAFTKYKVKGVPAVVLAKADSVDKIDEQGCALPDTYAAVFGDVSLDYSLDEIAQRDPRFTDLAKRYNRQLRGRQ